jgi:methionyl-tRNA synthetase
MTRRCNLTTAIPFVNGKPHLGFALELVQADALARHRRARGWDLRLQTGTDDNSLKSLHAAEAAGVAVRELVDTNAAAFAALSDPLRLSFDDFIRTSVDSRHRPGVERLWAACLAAGDLYRKPYRGRYCAGCEQFFAEADLTDDGRCPEHGVVPDSVEEENWFFRLSRYQDRLHDLIASDRLRIRPESRRNEALAFVAAGLEDFSVSRSATRARGWGIPVPGDSGQVIYVWFDALANYVTALGYGGHDPSAYRRWWLESDERVHLIGKGILRFHAVYWPAILLSAGAPPPTEILVHDYLTVDGRKIGKSLGNAVDPVELVERYGPDAVRWWLLRDPSPVGETDFTTARLVERANADLANGFGNLTSRVATLAHRRLDGAVPTTAALPLGEHERRLLDTSRRLPATVDTALDRYDLRRACGALLEVVAAANRYLDTVQPWRLAGPALEGAVAALVDTGRTLAVELAPFVPDLAERLRQQFGGADEALPAPEPLYPRLVQSKERRTKPVRGLGQK